MQGTHGLQGMRKCRQWKLRLRTKNRALPDIFGCFWYKEPDAGLQQGDYEWNEQPFLLEDGWRHDGCQLSDLRVQDKWAHVLWSVWGW